MIAIDLPVLLLLAGGVVLVVSTALTAVPRSRSHTRRGDGPTAFDLVRQIRRRRRPEPMVISHRRVVTGRPPVMPTDVPPAASVLVEPLALGPGRRSAAPRDGSGHDDVSRAEAEIEHLLDTDPERLARVMMAWIRDDPGSRS